MDKTYIKGNYRKSIYKSDQGYVIGLFKVRETNITNVDDYLNKVITFTGYFAELNEDDTYTFYGEEINHPRYGVQFQVSEYEKLLPEDKEGLIEFLSSNLFPKVGEKLAKNIVETLGTDVLNMVLNDYTCLLLVPKMTELKARKIKENLEKYEESHQILVYLTNLGFVMREALLIYNTYKKNTVSQIEHNIYKLAFDIKELSFLKIDHVASNNDFICEEERSKACIFYVMNKLTYEKSDTYLSYDDISFEAQKYNCLLTENFFENLQENKYIVIENNRYYLKEMYDAEENIVRKVSILTKIPNSKYKNIDNLIKNQEQMNHIVYSDKQKQAIKKSLENNISIITGGPGTGKTTIIKAIMDIYQEIVNLPFDVFVSKVALLAPTGRAAKRMSEATCLPAFTIHRFLKWRKDSNSFEICEENKSEIEFLIIDEVSMIDISLLDNLFKGLTDNIKIIFVGDYNQLPSVGPGQVLKDLIESEVIDTTFLNLLYRQDETSYIPYLASDIKNGEVADFLEPKDDYMFLKCQQNQIKTSIVNLANQIKDKNYDYKQVQFMAPMYKGENGIDNLNVCLQNIFNPKDLLKKELIHGDTIFREGDKVLQLLNIPDDNVFNGDIGVIKEIKEKGESGKPEIIIDFDSNLVTYTPKDFNKIKHGFIISIHKSQGSEFDLVIIPICNSFKRMLYRKLIYTAITRAKKKLILVGEPDSFVYSVSNNTEYLRKTTLLTKLVNNLLK